MLHTSGYLDGKAYSITVDDETIEVRFGNQVIVIGVVDGQVVVEGYDESEGDVPMMPVFSDVLATLGLPH